MSNMSDNQTITTYREDYVVPYFLIEDVELTFDLNDDFCIVTSKINFFRNPNADSLANELFLDGDSIKPESILFNGKELSSQQYKHGKKGLTIFSVTDRFNTTIVTHLKPQDNTTLMGLYKSSGNYCTQCEAEGFRKITFFPDRPDVLSTYTTTIIADKSEYPVLLSNGNQIASGESQLNRHWVTWHDPHPKPSYLFAIVAGDLAHIHDSYTTCSNKQVDLYVYSEHHNIDKCHFAIESLKKCMRWDEQSYGLEYDLDIFIIVAIDDFNMGAMENKGLNIFNTQYVLASVDTATDKDYLDIESVIAHEYFHNYSGNRVTLRDWFQLSLKEGFTVYRDQSYSSDMNSYGVKRVHDVNVLRSYQFREDSGPMAHPVRPESYQQINNFYTLTVYNKGAELVRMIATILGKEGFRKGADYYFKQFDAQAVSIEDFLFSMEHATKTDLSQFRLWYSQAGTPKIKVNEHYDQQKSEYILNLHQYCDPTPGQATKKPFHIPINLALFKENKEKFSLDCQELGISSTKNATLNFTKHKQQITFKNIESKPICSFLRDFSAPVLVEFERTQQTLSFLMANDDDAYNRWDASQELMTTILLGLITDVKQGKKLQIDDHVIEAIKNSLTSPIEDFALLASVLTPPNEIILAGKLTTIDHDSIHKAREFFICQIAERLQTIWLALYEKLSDKVEYKFNKEAVGKRSLRRVCLSYLMSLDKKSVWDIAEQQYYQSDNMTCRFQAFDLLINSSSVSRKSIDKDFLKRYQDDSLVMDKWLATHARVVDNETLKKIKKLEKHRVFDDKNPNKIRSLVASFCAQNPVIFHKTDGSGYKYLSQWIIYLDGLNPQLAANFSRIFNNWRRYDDKRQELMRKNLQSIANIDNISSDVHEIVTKALNF